MKGLFRAAMALGAAVLAMGQAPAPNWNTQFVETSGGHRVGNPAAKVKLTAFESYTCPHCANFEREAEGALRVVYIHSGNLSLEVRHIIRDPIDLTVAMLANCGPKEKFFDNHRVFMLSQSTWLAGAVNPSQARLNRWTSGDPAARRRNIAQDLGLYAIMENRGYTQSEANQCINDDAMARKLATDSAANGETYGVRGTPSFAINGTVLENVHTWQSLSAKIDERL
ncbi:MAG TPA: thioredoxin domain-containing protein [Sphingomonadaceae bacterium]|nr:thioredoxin domain-containing protein [Sphingomonadaceae bacterium]